MLGWNFLHGIVTLLVAWISFDCCRAIECNLYLAESTIPNAGLGVFAGIEFNAGDPVGIGGVAVPIFNSTPDEIYDYIWAGETKGMKLETVYGYIEAICPGLDCALNCNLALINVARAKPMYDDSGLHRSRDPAAGSITPYHYGTTRATRKVPAGGELFKHYGDEWFNGRPDLFGDSFPLTEDYATAQEIIDDAFSFGEVIAGFILEEIIFPIQSVWDSGTLNAMPKTVDEATIAFREEIEMVYQPNATRSIDWLEENGKCVDHIVPKESTIEGAGRGAFANRDLPKGTIITGSPLHHIPYKNNFVPLFRTVRNDNPAEEPQHEFSQQLLLNYCFGHAESTLLLCPYGVGISYINHNQTQANVEVVWPKDGLKPHDEAWLQRRPEEMIESSGSHLVFDYVATRDIADGEELFLDYGDDWEEAWKEHGMNWKSERIWSSSYISARRWNDKVAGVPLRTAVEAEADPYPANLHIRCHSSLEENEWGSFEEWPLSEYGYPCEIKERKKKDGNSQDFVYSVKIVTEKFDRWDTEFERSETLHVDDVPRNAIGFFDVPFTSDLHLRGAFRQPIGIPETVMPNAWKNVPISCDGVSPDKRSNVCLH